MAPSSSRHSQLQWMGLVAIAVVLPTVSLLWFMGRVVANERLVVRQKLTALYQGKLAEAFARTETLLAARFAELDAGPDSGNPYPVFRRLVLEQGASGMVLWRADGYILYPQSADVITSDDVSSDLLAGAWEQEFARRQYAEAAGQYDTFVSHPNRHVALAALIGKSRSLQKLGRLDEAIRECQRAAFPEFNPGREDPHARAAISNARLLLLAMVRPPGSSPAREAVFRRTIAALYDEVYNSSGTFALPAQRNLFVARKLLETTAGIEPPRPYDRATLQALVAAEEWSIAAADDGRSLAGPLDTIVPVFAGRADGNSAADPARPQYGFRHRVGSRILLVRLSESGLQSLLRGYDEVFAGSDSVYRILDSSGAAVAGPREAPGTPFATETLPERFPGWKIELHFAGGVFEKAARKQIAIYTWTGVLVIALMLLAGGLALLAVGRQIRLNRMKNDFIATVSHELKTPLSSMRVVIDTLLEGHVRDETQAHEYLRLAARENERLSRMIDNFLTFSRMERNKNAFTMADASPAAIARDAAESVGGKLAAHQCRFTVEVAEGLPAIQADHDALVTVLVNLLDNACKYTTTDKQIGLKVFAEAQHVCFAISDNGIGLSRRHQQRIFERFYQVDRSLARRAEGCGLGLSIVKFIVDAHKGRVTVDSKPGKGSTFVVRLPVGHRKD